MAHRRSALHARPQSLRRQRGSRTVLFFATSSIHILAPAAGCSEPVPSLVICSGCRPCVARQGRRGKPGLCPVQVPRAAHRFSAVAGPCEAGALGEARALSRASTECCTAPQVREQFAESRQVCRNFEVESARDCQSLPNARRKSHPARRTCRSLNRLSLSSLQGAHLYFSNRATCQALARTGQSDRVIVHTNTQTHGASALHVLVSCGPAACVQLGQLGDPQLQLEERASSTAPIQSAWLCPEVRQVRDFSRTI